MVLPNLIGVFFHLDLDSQLTDGTDDHIDAVVVTGQDALVVIWPRMICAMDLFAPITFKGQEILLLTFTE